MGDYKELLEKRGHNILIWEDFGSYQGDYVALLDGSKGFGFVVIGYGSCSGCDALEAAESNWLNDDGDSESRVSNLIDSIERDIFWGTKQQILDRINDENLVEWWRTENNERGLETILDFLKGDN
jgi:hypothetical protein